jgi:ABC-2 type transport system ATP-binding protein
MDSLERSGIMLAGITHAYSGRKALDDVSLTLPLGQSMALLGPNGAGKSTLLNILCGLVKPTAGTAFLAGVDIRKHSDLARRQMGVVFQDDSLDDRLSAWENLEFHGLVYGMDRPSRVRRIDEVLELVELTDWAENPVRTFSGGMKRRLEIARALMHEPKILILDEPTVGLDAQTRAKIWSYLNQQRRDRGLTVFVTTHYIEEAESCDLICVIDRGRIQAIDTPAELKSQFAKGLIRCLPRDAETRRRLLEKWPEGQMLADDRLGITIESKAMLDELLIEFGTSLKEIQIDEPSLETVFLAITGREMREREEVNPKGRAKRNKRI